MLFYREADISAVIMCGMCTGKFNDPRILPCGHTYCHKCIQLWATSNGQDCFQCIECETLHQIPEGQVGFPPNHVVVELLKQPFGQVSLSSEFKRLEKNLKNAKMEISEMEKIIKTPEDEVVEYCDRKRNQIDLEYEQELQALSDYRDDQLVRIDEYQKRCFQRIKSQANTFALNQSVIDEMKENAAKWKTILIDFHLDKKQFEQAIKESDRAIDRLRSAKRELEELILDDIDEPFSSTFNRNQFETNSFSKNSTENQVSSLVSDSEEIDPSEYATIHLRKLIKEVPIKNSVKIMRNGLYVMSFVKSFKFYCLCVLDIEKNRVVASSHVETTSTQLCHLFTSNNLIFTKVPLSNKACLISVYNQRLERLASMQASISLMSVDENQVYLANLMKTRKKQLRIYDHKLNFIRDVVLQQADKFSDFHAHNKVLFVYSNYHQITVFDINTGDKITQFEIFFQPHMENSRYYFFRDQIWVLEQSSNMLPLRVKAFNKNGEIVKETKVTLNAPVTHLLLDHNERVSFFDFFRSIVYHNFDNSF